MPSGIPQPGPTDSSSTPVPESRFAVGAVLSLHQDPPPSPAVFPRSWLKAGHPCSWSDAEREEAAGAELLSPRQELQLTRLCPRCRNTHGEQGAPAPGG